MWGWCKKREDYRLFKLNRMENLQISEQADGKLLFQVYYTDKENLLTWLLFFRDKVELLEPEEIRAEIRNSIECMKKKYER